MFDKLIRSSKFLCGIPFENLRLLVFITGIIVVGFIVNGAKGIVVGVYYFILAIIGLILVMVSFIITGRMKKG